MVAQQPFTKHNDTEDYREGETTLFVCDWTEPVSGDSSMSLPVSIVYYCQQCPCTNVKLSLKGWKKRLKLQGNTDV